jgi:hypothetical protein
VVGRLVVGFEGVLVGPVGTRVLVGTLVVGPEGIALGNFELGWWVQSGALLGRRVVGLVGLLVVGEEGDFVPHHHVMVGLPVAVVPDTGKLVGILVGSPLG